MKPHELVTRLTHMARLSAMDPTQAVRLAGGIEELAAALEVACAQSDASPSHIYRVPGFAIVPAGASSGLTPIDFGMSGRVVGVRAALRDFVLGSLEYQSVGVNFLRTGGTESFVANGQATDFISLATLGAPASVTQAQIWYPIDVRIPSSDTKLMVQVQNQSLNPVTPDVYFAFVPDRPME